MTEQSLRSILRDPSYPRELRAKALRLIVQSAPIGLMVDYQNRLITFRTDMGGTFVPELMVA